MLIRLILNFAFFIYTASAIRIIEHPLEKRIAYVYGVKSTFIGESKLAELTALFREYPLLIFKDLQNINPNTFINFVKRFDNECDEAAIRSPDEYPNQMLQPFYQLPDCKHVAPIGNVELFDFYDIKNIRINPANAFINNYLWHSDILGHEFKLPNVVTGFYIIEQPLIGGDTDFISGETVYENMNLEEQTASQNVLIEINRRKFLINEVEIDYSGVNRLEPFVAKQDGKTKIPLVFAADPNNREFEKPRVLIMPSFFEKISGLNVNDSRKWIRRFMNEKVLPHRVSIQWKKGDLAIFNNRRFMHSSTPARNYMDNADSSKRLLLQTFIPTKRPIYGIMPSHKNSLAGYNVNWFENQEDSMITTHDHYKFAKSQEMKNRNANETINTNDNYVLFKHT